MDTTFYIVLNMKTVSGFEPFGRFNLGNDREAAHALFSQLKGSREVDEKAVLQLDLMEVHDGLPMNLNVLGCTLCDLAENCKIITKETFRLNSLERL